MTTERYSPLLTDLYQLTMLSAYYELGMEHAAVFEFFVRRLPEARNFLVAAGLEQVLAYLEGLRFSEADLKWLDNTGRFQPRFLRKLEKFRFAGDVYAMPEGTVFFEDEPVLRIVAPLPQAQLVESRVINLLNLQTLIASKAARCRLAAGKKQLIDFGMRRAQGAEAAVLGARASYIAGFDATACVESSRLFGMPMSGTMAHSFVQAHDKESEAFANFAKCHPEPAVLLIDTYDTAAAAQSVVRLCQQGTQVGAVRIDSGDLGEEAKRVRAILDAGGCGDVKIVASGNLDELLIERLLRGAAPIDAFGVGTRLSVSADAPSLDCAYKLHEYAGTPRRKRSASKANWPGSRNVHRSYDHHGYIAMDLIGCAEEACEGKSLLQHVMSSGHRTCAGASLSDIRQHCVNEVATLPPAYRGLEHGPRSPIKISERLHALAAKLDAAAH